MSQDARRARRAGKVMLQLYREQAPRVSEITSQLGVTCREGCSHCCMLPATATVPEMVPIVEHLTSRCDWPHRRPALERELTRHLRELSTINVLDPDERKSFFQRELPCVFLRDRHCEVYTVRPIVCRYHMATSPPDNCAKGAADPTVVLVDLHAVESDLAIRGAQAFGELVGGPLALAFVLAADLLDVRLHIDRELVKHVTRVCIKMQGLP